MNHGIISYVCRMKPIKLIASALLISACTPTSQPDNPGNTVENLIFTKVEILEAPGSGDSRGDITLDFSNDKGESLHLETTSLTCCLEDGFYEITPDPKTPCQACTNGRSGGHVPRMWSAKRQGHMKRPAAGIDPIAAGLIINIIDKISLYSAHPIRLFLYS